MKTIINCERKDRYTICVLYFSEKIGKKFYTKWNKRDNRIIYNEYMHIHDKNSTKVFFSNHLQINDWFRYQSPWILQSFGFLHNCIYQKQTIDVDKLLTKYYLSIHNCPSNVFFLFPFLTGSLPYEAGGHQNSAYRPCGASDWTGPGASHSMPYSTLS